MTDSIYKKKYNKYKTKYLNLKSKKNIYLGKNISQYDRSSLEKGLGDYYNVQTIADEIFSTEDTKMRGTYITNSFDDCTKSKSKFDKIILLADKENQDKLECCSITCGTTAEIIDYLLMDDYHLGLTYSFDGNCGIKKLILHKKLRSWTIKYGQPTFVDYLNQGPESNGKLSKDLDSTKTVLRNMINISTISHITDKQKLYQTMKSEYSDFLTFMPKTTDLVLVNDIDKNKILIVKEVDSMAHGGTDISLVTNNSELQAAKDSSSKNKKKWIASEYIINPLLFNGIKFHLCCYLMVTSLNKFYYFSEAEILVAKEKYKPSDFHNKNIHDSGGSMTRRYFYPKDLDDPRIGAGISKIMERLISVLKSDKYPKISTYGDDKYGYDIIGINILFDDTYNPWLLGVDTNIKYVANHSNEQYELFGKSFLTWEYDTIIRPIFSKISFVPFAKINDKMIKELLYLTLNPVIMENIGRGELWDRKKLMQMLEEEKKDTSDIASKQYFSWIVCLRYGIQKVVGYVSIRPMFKSNQWEIGPRDLQIRIFTYPSQGYGTSIMEKIVKFASNNHIKLWAIIHSDNKISISFFKKLGWKEMGVMKLGGNDNMVFKYE